MREDAHIAVLALTQNVNNKIKNMFKQIIKVKVLADGCLPEVSERGEKCK